jgi:tripartite-type tricarboxylate transporter receptor subunit TctC
MGFLIRFNKKMSTNQERKDFTMDDSRKTQRPVRALALAASVLTLLGVGTISATAGDDAFFKGKTMQMIVPHGAGGGFDTYARATAPYLEEFLGVTIVVENVRGAGGDIGRNQLYRADPDGLTIGFSSFPSMVFSQLSGADSVQYDVSKWEMLGRMVAESEVISVPAAGKYQSLEEIVSADGPIRIPLSGVGDDTFFKAMIVGKALGIDLIPVTGYDGSAEAFAAGMRGDAEILSSSLGTSLPLIESGEIKPILQISLVPASEIDGVPLASEIIEDEAMRGFVEDIAGIAALDRSFFAPPGVPEDRLEVLRAAVGSALQNPDFLAHMEKIGRAVNFMPADEATKILKSAMANSAKLVPLLQEALAAAQ